MQSFSIHHCVLIFLTLTFTTASVSAAVCSTSVKLHQPVILSCEHKCSASVKWTLFQNRDVVFARCDQTSCTSQQKGYTMSHDQYLKGNLSLSIAAANYSERNTYTCECGVSDITTVRLSIETVFSAVQKNSAEDLLLDLSVPEPVKVFYRSSDSADDELICNVTQSSAQCSSEYTSRTSLHHPQLTLRGVTSSDSGTYTIQSTEYNEDIHVYNVSVTERQVRFSVTGASQCDRYVSVRQVRSMMEKVMKSLEMLSEDGEGHLQGNSVTELEQMEQDLIQILEWCREKMSEFNKPTEQHRGGEPEEASGGEMYSVM
ncbi:hypothetical protein C0J45_8911 [Silurus meridionalis]|nr:hypothetical protein C0J45_8911 [Silurus meridionalis]